ncbi:2'-5' RNA ligase family protein [Hamadaea tsunoensis]|uniref:2'-5' RNA ligase family protein n=1 Tax=Hamadaea tsunoensis TaxID=53368 RepID=UPI00068487D6|nr:2'-5' RNA ligase family protein [Hamadaea tsunoensis]
MAETVRIGVAVDIPAPWGPRLTQARVAAGDPLGATVPAHLTLLGPTEVDPGDLGAIKDHLVRVSAAHRPFELLLRGTGTFRPVTEVVFVAVAAGISECELLAAAISGAPELDRPRHFPYHPHVTVAQEVAPEKLDQVFDELSTFEARFTVDVFRLHTHTGDIKSPDSQWHHLRDYRLAPAAPAPGRPRASGRRPGR